MFDARTTFQLGLLGDVLAMRPGRCVAGVVRGHSRCAGCADGRSLYAVCGFGAGRLAGGPSAGSRTCRSREGVWYPIGGTRAIPEALASLAESLGVEFTDQRELRGSCRQRSRPGSALEDGETVALMRWFPTATPCGRIANWLGAHSARVRERSRYEPACSGVVLYLGLEAALQPSPSSQFRLFA